MEETLAPPAPVTPRVTVILIVRDQAAALRRCVAALESSSNRAELEILAVDCASSDDPGAVAADYPGLILQRLPQDFGSTKALNIATRTARTDLLLFLSPEVMVEPDTIPRLMAALEAHADTTAACPLLVDPSGAPLAFAQALPTKESLAAVCGGGPPPTLTLDAAQESVAVGYPGRDALLVRKQFILGMNYFDERFGEYWADADLAMKIRSAQRKIRVFPAIRATLQRVTVPQDPILTSDRIVGAAHLLGKYDGFFAGLSFRLGAMLSALLRGDFATFSGVLGGKTVGSQASASYPV